MKVTCRWFYFHLILFLIPFSHVISQQITFNEHIAPIVYKHCTICHHKDAPGPFTLLTYKDVASHAKMIVKVTESRYMPPWKADPGYRHFDGERILSVEEIAMIKKWVAGGTPEGKDKPAPQIPDFPVGSLLGKPDMVLKMKEPLFIKGNNEESFTIIKIPYEIKTDSPYVNISAIEWVPDHKKIVHHAVFEFDGVYTYTDLEKEPYIFKLSPGVEYSPYSYLKIDYKETSYRGGWLPGKGATILDDGIGIKIPRKGVVVYKNIHYDASPIDIYDDPKINVFFKKAPVKSQLLSVLIGTTTTTVIPPLIIPADSIKKFSTSTKFLVDVNLLFLTPHMHLLGKEFRAFFTTPDNDTVPLIYIPRWDFNWQEIYKLNPYVFVPAGSIVHVEGIFDNTSGNPNNPFHPPRTIYSGETMKTTEEMMQFVIDYITVEK